MARASSRPFASASAGTAARANRTLAGCAIVRFEPRTQFLSLSTRHVCIFCAGRRRLRGVPDRELRPRLVPRVFASGVSTRGRSRDPEPLRHKLLAGAAQPAATTRATTATSAATCRPQPTSSEAASASSLSGTTHSRRRKGLAGRLSAHFVRTVQECGRRLRRRDRGRAQRAARLGRAVRRAPRRAIVLLGAHSPSNTLYVLSL
jgi:hypothetical protein